MDEEKITKIKHWLKQNWYIALAVLIVVSLLGFLSMLHVRGNNKDFAAHEFGFAKTAVSGLRHHIDALPGEHIERMPTESAGIDGALSGYQCGDVGTGHGLAAEGGERIADVAHHQASGCAD